MRTFGCPAALPTGCAESWTLPRAHPLHTRLGEHEPGVVCQVCSLEWQCHFVQAA